MDIEKDSNREAFEAWFESRYDAHFMQFALDLDMYVDKHTQTCWEAWQAAKAQAVSDTYTQIVLVLESVQSKIAKTSFLTMDEENENEVMAVDANELAAYIDKLIEAQEPAND